jgi:hypothetical protein
VKCRETDEKHAMRPICSCRANDGSRLSCTTTVDENDTDERVVETTERQDLPSMLRVRQTEHDYCRWFSSRTICVPSVEAATHDSISRFDVSISQLRFSFDSVDRTFHCSIVVRFVVNHRRYFQSTSGQINERSAHRR